jgi:hypothetical protein
MARISGVPEPKAGLFARFVYRASRKLFGKVAEALTVTANHKHVFFGAAMMERAQAKSEFVPMKLKALAELRTAAMVGCPF